MTATVPLSALVTCLEDIDAPLTRKFPFSNATYLHRDMEYLWGLEIYTIDPTHERNILHIRKSMEVPFSGGVGSWTLVPTEETLVAMNALQVHNFTVPVSKRKSFLTEFSATEYEYIFVPLNTGVDFFILLPGEAPRRFSTPYTDFPRVTSTASPFFVTFESRLKMSRSLMPHSTTWQDVFGNLTLHWTTGVIPEEFFVVSYPESLATVVDPDDGSEPDALLDGPESKSGSDETIMTPTDEEGPSPVPHKDAFVHEWVERDAKRRRKDPVPSNPPPPPAPRTALRRDVTRRLPKTVRAAPQWREESQRGKDVTAHTRNRGGDCPEFSSGRRTWSAPGTTRPHCASRTREEWDIHVHKEWLERDFWKEDMDTVLGGAVSFGKERELLKKPSSSTCKIHSKHAEKPVVAKLEQGLTTKD
ncbi:hypothetical protein K438DRAFT_1756942 [Mycena galopus ATCC 62051]|nr:hypothetical protein K438DRAFT_1756942 [Mycena galopus ATCC 62051]